MSKTVRIILIVLAALGIIYYALFNVSIIPSTSDYKVDLAAMRRAAQQSGSLPVAINAIAVGTGQFPAKGVVAGASFFKKAPIHVMSYQIVYADGHTGILDTAHDAKGQKDLGGEFHPDRYAEMQAAMRRADWIVLTHEHPDHLGGLARSKYFDELAPKAHLTSEQLGSKFPEVIGMTQEQLTKLKPLQYSGLHTLAPGVILQKAAGHSPGSQLVFVLLANGEEFLFIGDIAWNVRNLDIPRSRPVFVSWLFLQEDRSAVAAQLRTLHDLRKQTRMVVGHDGPQVQDFIKQGLMGGKFR